MRFRRRRLHNKTDLCLAVFPALSHLRCGPTLPLLMRKTSQRWRELVFCFEGLGHLALGTCQRLARWLILLGLLQRQVRPAPLSLRFCCACSTGLPLSPQLSIPSSPVGRLDGDLLAAANRLAYFHGRVSDAQRTHNITKKLAGAETWRVTVREIY